MALVTNVVKGSDAERLLLMLHGYGADERDLGGLLPYLDPDGVFAAVLPRAPLAVPGTPGYAWYEFGAADAAGGAEQALADLDDLLDEQCEALGFPRETAVVGGLLARRRPRARARPAREREALAGRGARDEPGVPTSATRLRSTRARSTFPCSSSTAPTTR